MRSVQVAEQDELDADAAACSAERMLAVLDAGSPGCRARSRLCSFSCISNPLPQNPISNLVQTQIVHGSELHSTS